MTTNRRDSTVSIRLSADELARIDAYAAAGFGGNRTQAILAACDLAAAPDGGRPGLEADTWEALRQAARSRLRRALTEPELLACLQATRSWYVTGMDASLIHVEISDMAQDDVDASPDPLFGHGPATSAPVTLSALALKLAAMSELDRAVLTLACREWWDADPKPGIETILGGRLRGPRDN